MIVAKFSDLSFRAKRGVVEESLTVLLSCRAESRHLSPFGKPDRIDESVGVANAHPSFPIASVGQTSMARSAAAISSGVSGCLEK
jgi:hypothetical protein